MRKIILAIVIIVVVSIVLVSCSSVPENVRTAVKVAFPDAEILSVEEVENVDVLYLHPPYTIATDIDDLVEAEVIGDGTSVWCVVIQSEPTPGSNGVNLLIILGSQVHVDFALTMFKAYGCNTDFDEILGRTD
jgi:hypothetical protein